MNEEWVKKAINEYSKEINGRIIIVDKNNIVKGDSNNLFIGDTFKHDEIQKALNGENSRRVYNFRDTGRVMYVSVPVILNDEIVGATLISVSIDNIYLEVKHISRKVALISGISMLVTAIIAFFFSDAIFKPLGQLKNAINKVAQGHLEEKVNIDSNDEFKEVAEAFNIMILKLDQVDTQRKDFVANVSHELRTPLTSIKILSESLISGEDFNVDVYKEFLTDIDSEVDRLNNIITDLLTLVDLDKEKLTLDLKITYMNFLLERIYLRLKPLAEKKSIDLELVLNEKIQLKVDNEKIQQAIINIIDNAIKYTQTGGKVKLKLYNEGKYAIIEIKDNGIGIPEENIQNIFERFYRVDKARSRDTGGTGLGLSIAWQIVSLHQGTIEVESKVGVGSTFYIKLPITT
ncbi:sensor histidine kinase [Sporanaerobacter acetigenes]|nr:ATP-binding protein [Sporanaerobacter acetigenes]